jgi:hypothetical protein
VNLGFSQKVPVKVYVKRVFLVNTRTFLEQRPADSVMVAVLVIKVQHQFVFRVEMVYSPSKMPQSAMRVLQGNIQKKGCLFVTTVSAVGTAALREVHQMFARHVLRVSMLKILAVHNVKIVHRAQINQTQDDRYVILVLSAIFPQVGLQHAQCVKQDILLENTKQLGAQHVCRDNMNPVHTLQHVNLVLLVRQTMILHAILLAMHVNLDGILGQTIAHHVSNARLVGLKSNPVNQYAASVRKVLMVQLLGFLKTCVKCVMLVSLETSLACRNASTVHQVSFRMQYLLHIVIFVLMVSLQQSMGLLNVSIVIVDIFQKHRVIQNVSHVQMGITKTPLEFLNAQLAQKPNIQIPLPIVNAHLVQPEPMVQLAMTGSLYVYCAMLEDEAHLKV